MATWSGGSPSRSWDKSWQVWEKVGRFGQKVGRLGKKLTGLGKKLAGWGKSWQVCEKSWQDGKKLAGWVNSWQVAGFEFRSWQVVKRCRYWKFAISKLSRIGGMQLCWQINLISIMTWLRSLIFPRPRTCYRYLLSENQISKKKSVKVTWVKSWQVGAEKLAGWSWKIGMLGPPPDSKIYRNPARNSPQTLATKHP